MSGEYKHYAILDDKTITSEKFNLEFRKMHVQFNNNFQHVPVLKLWIHVQDVFESLIKDLTKGIPETHKANFILRSTQLKEPLCIPFCPVKEITPEKVLSTLERILQTNTEFTFDDTVKIEFNHIKVP